jgi:mycofactocin system transcriptional regulator
MTDPEPAVDRGGRPASTSPHELAAEAQRLFVEKGFDQTSVEDITAAVGVSRRTFFRYFPTKADVVWVESDAELGRLRAGLAAAGPSERYQSAIKRSVAEALWFPPAEEEWARHRAQLLLTVPAVQAHGMVLYAAWRTAAAEFAAARTGLAVTALFPTAVGFAVLAGTFAAHEHWITTPGTNLFAALDEALTVLLPKLPSRSGP